MTWTKRGMVPAAATGPPCSLAKKRTVVTADSCTAKALDPHSLRRGVRAPAAMILAQAQLFFAR